MLLLNSYSEIVRRQAIEILLNDARPVSTGVLNNETESTFVTNYTYTPRSILMVPAISVVGNNDTIGMTFLEHTWDAGFRGILQGFSSLHAVVTNTCGDQFTLTINGNEATYLGEGDLHNTRYNSFVVATSETEQLHYWESMQSSLTQSFYYYTAKSAEWIVQDPLENECRYQVRFFPTDDYYNLHTTGRAIRYALGVSFLFIFTILCFIAYDALVEKRQSIVMNTAVVSSDIVNQLYPPSFVRRFTQCESVASTERKTIQLSDSKKKTKSDGRNVAYGSKELSSLKDILLRGSLSDSIQRPSKIFAEMFTDVSVIFADISGFTAWSSERGPVQVFQLLEALYSAFDEVAKDLGVFKVETIGDCYVAVVGLPTPRPAHAVVSCRFAHEIHKCIHKLTKELEVQLGPGTSDLQLRIGIHSGPVTAGVLRGEKSRFQLFGDTMNTAARMESTGKRGMTHVSEDTAKLLAKFGKEYWVTSRDEVVYAKGKGELQTYWVHTKHRRNKSSQSHTLSSKNATTLDDFIQAQESNASKNDEDWALLSVEESCMEDKEGTQKERLIGWNTEILFKMLCRLEWNRMSVPISETFDLHPDQVDDVFMNNEQYGNCLPHVNSSASNSQNSDSTTYSRVLTEIMGKQDVNMPTFDESIVEELSDTSCILSDGIRMELKLFVTDIAEHYSPLPFRKFAM
jgi:class 3 adenylate cyclase